MRTARAISSSPPHARRAAFRSAGRQHLFELLNGGKRWCRRHRLSTVNVVRVRSATPVDRWPTGPVTLLGDAIHNMTPMGGIGANTGLRDADLLRRRLTAVSHGEQELIPAVHAYEAQMLDYGFAAVKRSLRNAQQAGSANRFGRIMFRGALRTMSVLPPIKTKLAAALGN
jgi:2-polyprenyl-6-methoxyphenol hydroxylase-like FAD-dependent oxidoreductase